MIKFFAVGLVAAVATGTLAFPFADFDGTAMLKAERASWTQYVSVRCADYDPRTTSVCASRALDEYLKVSPVIDR
ncbi:MAG TPA: hypothetical protein VIY48_20235 [Candidatus Paceibacterota bacterium]